MSRTFKSSKQIQCKPQIFKFGNAFFPGNMKLYSKLQSNQRKHTFNSANANQQMETFDFTEFTASLDFFFLCYFEFTLQGEFDDNCN